jgi:hypothetical protein
MNPDELNMAPKSQLDFCSFFGLYSAGARAYISTALIGRDSFEKAS